MTHHPGSTRDPLEEELEASLMLLEQPGRKVLVIGMVIERDGTTRLAHSVSDGTSRDDGLIFAAGLTQKVDFLLRKILP